MQPVDACDKAAQAFKVVHDQRHRAQHGGKGTGGLDGAPHFQFAVQHAAGQNHTRQHHGELAERALEQVERALLLDQAGVVGEHVLESQVDLRTLLRFAAVKGNRLGVFAQAHQAKAKIRLAPQLPEVELDERRAKHVQRDKGAQHRVHRQKGHQHPRDRPQHGAERHQLHQRAEQDQHEMHRAAGEAVDVFADALVGVVDAAAVAEFVVAAPAQVAVQKAVREPAPPVVGKRIAHVVIEHVHRHRKGQHQQAQLHRVPEAVAVAGGQGRGHLAAFVDQQHRQLRLQQHQRDQHRHQRPGGLFAVAAPVRQGHFQKLPPGGHGQRGRAPLFAWRFGCVAGV